MPADVRKIAQDAAYVTVGAGVLAVQRAQVLRREARSRVEAQVAVGRELLTGGLGDVRARAEPVRDRIRTVIEPVREQIVTRVAPVADRVQDRLPETVAQLVRTGRERLPRAGGASSA